MNDREFAALLESAAPELPPDDVARDVTPWRRAIGNILGGAVLPDILCGSLATLIGAFFTYQLRNKSPYLAPLPPIAANTLIVPFVLRYAYGVALPIPFMMLTVGIGEVVSCGILGMIVYFALKKYRNVVFQPIKRNR